MASKSAIMASMPFSNGIRESLTLGNVVVISLGCFVVYQLLMIAYNLSPFHPLSHIPGPRLAAATYIPEFWHDVVTFGRYTHEIKKMHDAYGPIVRVNPNEVHINDIRFMDEIYAAGGRKRDKAPYQIANYALRGTGFGTSDHDHHRMRRAPVSKFFSRNQIAQLEPHVQHHVQVICNKILAERGNKEALSTQEAFNTFSGDVISGYCFGESFNFLEQDGWHNFREPTKAFFAHTFFARFFPILGPALFAGTQIPGLLTPNMKLLMKTLTIDLPNLIKRTQQDIDEGIQREYPTILGALLKSNLPPEEKAIPRLASEAFGILNGGTETTAWTLSILTYYLLTQPETLAKLTAELKENVPDPLNLPSWSQLEQLPYLSATIQEALRLSHGSAQRSSRIATGEDLTYRYEKRVKGTNERQKAEYRIPRGYAVGMSNPLLLTDPEQWPNPYEFSPERWLVSPEKRKEMDKNMVAFGRGTRMCVGMNLAICEIHLLLTALVLRVYPHTRLFETTKREVTWDHDAVTPQIPEDSPGVRILIV
ncbi:hypothetical protein M426DRAFT_322616 [Hypoxylon sp. CI-4A]|nr:hypothetical protein M426DRAFT_322616 [Hypoxylon sp. CI-4A]